MGAVELYHERAAECLDLARRLHGQIERARMMELAGCWERLAEHAQEADGAVDWHESYRRSAAECVRLAKSMRIPGDKALLIQMAGVWLGMAQRATTAHKTDQYRA